MDSTQPARGSRLKFGLSLFTSDRGISPADAAKAAEDRGFDTFYVPEHTHIPVVRSSDHPATGDETLPDDRYLRTLDPWVALGTAAAVTTRIGLGTSVALPAAHDPIALAKTIATADHLCGGRIVFGVGYGWNLEELADHGVPANRRRTVLREYLEAMTALWTQEEAAYEGTYVQFGASWAWPKPIQQPRPPILVGAGGTEKNFAWIVRSADGWITTPIETNIDGGVEQLREMWREAGRAGEPQVVVLAKDPDRETLAHWADIGVTEVVYSLPDADTAEVRAFIERLGDRLALPR
ncbi:LLM class F420-dependent oxidoreductase [Nocardia neocaledoniensis NBRC 108232]|uniref:Putative F420-dependent oxidoreductase n=1 Tax=Nocardia neocaledoniensis TaxID=236511 RepID=A0A317NA12_9NOCA|nr:putative F420-dependent oxidoreductase [Nocardia neocaledoniensis]GEM29266.1 LLM class F420-dependent oxidoreductase [Nocardia neocaledoniensis NBRC 108232]